jgi:hypothetical protein
MKRIKRIDEFLAAEPTTRPTTAPPITTPDTPARPQRPGPTVRPGEKEKEKPLAALNDLLDQFFAELEEIKHTPKGKGMIKKLYKKYAKN